MFINKVVVNGFQSLYDVTLEFGQFTVIHGESDVGKSAFYRALRAILLGMSGDEFISSGLDKTTVHVTLDSGESVLWSKKRGHSSSYKVGNKTYEKARAVPADIQKLFKIRKIDISGEEFYPNLRGQWDSLFALFMTPTKRAKALGFLISNVLLSGIRIANVERNRNEADIRVLNDLVADYERQLSISWEDVFSQINTLKDFYSSVCDSVTFKDKIYRLFGQCGVLDYGSNISSLFEETKKVKGQLGVLIEAKDKIGSLYSLCRKELSSYKIDLFDGKFFELLDKMVAFHSKIFNLFSEFKEASISYKECSEKFNKLDVELKTVKDGLEKVLVKCPECKAQFPLMLLKGI